MRTCSMIVFLSLTSAAGCEVAHLGETCGDFGTSCEEGTRCVDGTCAACGGLHEYCCAEAGGSTEICDGNVACNGATYDVGECYGDCGAVGLPCCDGGDCPLSGTCYLGKCIDDGTGDPCHDPFGQPHKVYVITAACGEPTLVTFTTKTPEEAEACRQTLIEKNLGSGADVEVCPLDGAYDYVQLCGYSDPNVLPNSVHFDYCSDDWLQHCKHQDCSNCTWSDPKDGVCPLEP